LRDNLQLAKGLLHKEMDTVFGKVVPRAVRAPQAHEATEQDTANAKLVAFIAVNQSQPTAADIDPHKDEIDCYFQHQHYWVDVLRNQGHGENDKDFDNRVGSELSDYFENFECIVKKLDVMKSWAVTGKS
jgi:hypothetical protein